jgi:endoglycosylceramidase
MYVAWQGVMPSPGVINTTYLDQVEQLVALLAAHNISSILDCHQDVFAPAFCGEGGAAAGLSPPPPHSPSPPPGAPEFVSDAVYHNSSRKPDAFPIPVSPTHHSYPLDPLTRHPNRTQCLQAPFWHYYFSDAVSKGFQSLYDNDGGVLDVFEQFWVTVATRFSQNPAVLGYELLNEPWVGDFYSNRSQLLARNADARNLVPM